MRKSERDKTKRKLIFRNFFENTTCENCLSNSLFERLTKVLLRKITTLNWEVWEHKLKQHKKFPAFFFCIETCKNLFNGLKCMYSISLSAVSPLSRRIILFFEEFSDGMCKNKSIF